VQAMSSMSDDDAHEDARRQLAREWASAVATTAYVPKSQREIERYLFDLVHPLLDALTAVPFAEDAIKTIERVGAALVHGHFTGPYSLQRTIQVLGRALPVHRELRRLDGLTEKVLAALGALSAGYVQAMRSLIFNQQEDLKRALLRARQDVERDLRISEARFRGVFTSTGVGIAITDLEGNFVETNAALTEILGYTAGELAERTMYDLFCPEDVPYLRLGYRDVTTVDTNSGGETAWVILAVSLLRDADGKPAYHVTLVEDITDLQLLHDRLSYQALHDVLTGLPNRQFFRTRLESVLGRLEPTDTITLFHLDLDGFSLINAGLGHHIGDKLLQVVAMRLANVFAEETVMIARVAGDEFAILVEHSETTPDVATLAARINEELSEPSYVDGRGLAVSVTIGAVQRRARGLDAAELIRAADTTLHRAKANGKRQWAVFDAKVDTAERDRFGLAAAMPGALETGEFRLVYQPQVRLEDKHITAIEAMVHWDHPERGVLPHEECIDLAEQTGIVLPLGQWMLRAACEQAVEWHTTLGPAAPPLSVHLASAQANDPDLLATVSTVLADLPLLPDSLQIGIPVRSLLCEDGDAEENLEVLAEMGVRVVLVGFGGGHGGLTFLEDRPVHAVKIAAWLVQRLAKRPNSLMARAVADLAALVHSSKASVITCNIDTVAQADWWRQLGADIAQGQFFAAPAPADQITTLLRAGR
jgi:diguanylate cyclase (GGDEF)-like protein/PAS domain S-box-containing protein